MTDTDDLTWFPRHPRLRPGLTVLRHDDGRWQLGTDPGDRVLLPHDPEVHEMLRSLWRQRPPDLRSPGVRRWAHELVARGLVVPAGDLARALETGMSRDAAFSAFQHPDGAARLAARRAARVRLECEDRWREEVTALLAAAHLPITRGERPAMVLAVRQRWEPREAVDGWMRSGVPHLLVRHDATHVEVGPLVVPGLTACLRCVDAHESDLGPHPTQLAPQGPVEEGHTDPLLLRLALTWAVRDLVAYVEGDEPSTWSASVRLDARLDAPRTAWTRHPRCGCAWGDELAAG